MHLSTLHCPVILSLVNHMHTSSNTLPCSFFIRFRGAVQKHLATCASFSNCSNNVLDVLQSTNDVFSV